MLSSALRKLKLQRLQVKFVRKGKNNERLREEKEVLYYLLRHPVKLLSKEPIDKDEKFAKQLNNLNANVNNDKLYEISKKQLSNV